MALKMGRLIDRHVWPRITWNANLKKAKQKDEDVEEVEKFRLL